MLKVFFKHLHESDYNEFHSQCFEVWGNNQYLSFSSSLCQVYKGLVSISGEQLNATCSVWRNWWNIGSDGMLRNRIMGSAIIVVGFRIDWEMVT